MIQTRTLKLNLLWCHEELQTCMQTTSVLFKGEAFSQYLKSLASAPIGFPGIWIQPKVLRGGRGSGRGLIVYAVESLVLRG